MRWGESEGRGGERAGQRSGTRKGAAVRRVHGVVRVYKALVLIGDIGDTGVGGLRMTSAACMQRT